MKSESINFIPFKNTLKLSVLKFKDVPPRSAPENNVWPESALYLKSVNCGVTTPVTLAPT